MYDYREIAAAVTLVEMANGLVQIQTCKSEAGCSGMKNRKRQHKDHDSSWDVDMASLADQPTSDIKKKCSKTEKAGDGSLGSRNRIRKYHDCISLCDPELATVERAKVLQQCITCGFSFSTMTIYLLSAIRCALITARKKQDNLPHLTLVQIVEFVRSKPGKPGILEAEKPLLELIRYSLKILSTAAPLREVDSKPLVAYEKTSRCWSWIGPLPPSLPNDGGDIEVTISPKSWGVPRETLINLVNRVSDWVEKSEETLRKIASLPPPPTVLMQPINMAERFKGIRRLTSFATIKPSSEEVKDYFHKEEVLRYSIPERAFSYTALDGGKSTVAPLVNSSGEPTTRSRRHDMLKDDVRPKYSSVLCVVRDAAARLPGRIGTRSDICLLVKDSQFIVKDISESKLTDLVSGALERLRRENDPCLKFDKDRHLWVYLHGDREDEDFVEEDAPSSSKIGADEMLVVDVGVHGETRLIPKLPASLSS